MIVECLHRYGLTPQEARQIIDDPQIERPLTLPRSEVTLTFVGGMSTELDRTPTGTKD